MSEIKIRIGTRKSQLAMAQTYLVESMMKKQHDNINIEIIGMTTTGDKVLDVSLSKIGEKSLFTKELEVALANNEVDIVVHSLKDLPTKLPDGMQIAAILEREDPRDAVIFHPKHKDLSLQSLPSGSVIGTSSLRRIAQLKSKYPHLVFKDVRGNLNTRLKKLEEDNLYDGLILAVAGIVRLGWINKIGQFLDKEDSLHAVCQGAIAIECRENDAIVLEKLKALNHNITSLRCLCERAFLRRLEGGCSVPIGVNSTYDESKRLTIEGGVFSLDGTKSVKGLLSDIVLTTEDAEILGQRLADTLISEGADKILQEIIKQKVSE